VEHKIFPMPSLYSTCYFTPDSRTLVAINGDTSLNEQSIHAIDTATGEVRPPIATQRSGELTLLMHPDSRHALHPARQSVDLWDLITGKLIRSYLKIDAARDFPDFHLPALSPSGQLLALGNAQDSGSLGLREYNVSLVDMDSGRLIRVLKNNKDREVIETRFSADGKLLFGFGYEYDFTDTLFIWEVSTGKLLQTFGRAGELDSNVSLSPTARFVAGTGDIARVWEGAAVSPIKKTWKLRHKFKGQKYGAWKIAFTPDESALAVMGMEAMTDEGDNEMISSVRIWDLASGLERFRLSVTGKIFCFAVSPNSLILAMMSGEVAFSADDRSEQYTLTIWDLATGQRIQEIVVPGKMTRPFHQHPDSMTFSSDGHWLAIAHLGCIALWDTKDIIVS